MKIHKLVRVIMIEEARESFAKLNRIAGQQTKNAKTNTHEIKLLISIKNKIAFIKQNPFYGDNIQKHLIPKQYKVPNLWRVE
jgi:hypothetical protein